jgi:signal transduction histidine kinase
MSTKPNNYHSLGRRIVAQFCIFTLVLSFIYSAMSFLLMYTLEDDFINNAMIHEVNFLIEGYQKKGEWPAPRNSLMQLHFSQDSLPAAVKSVLFAEPQRREFYGEQDKHYHLYLLPKVKDVYLLAEVSEMLLVRPISATLLKFMLALCLILMLVACSIAWLLGRKTAKPLQQLADLVDGVAPENIPDKFAMTFPNNEIGILARTLEQTMAQIKQALVREKHFTRDVSHELRTPVAIIKNAIEVYQSGHQQGAYKNTAEANRQTIDTIIKRIGDASVKMEQTVVTLLSLARSEQTSLERTPINLLSLIEQAVIDHSYLLNKKAVEVVVDDNTNTKLNLQKGMLKVLLDNLISNAFQYTDTGEVRISYEENQLVIADTGSGIEADIADRITELAVKGKESTGYGFGLSIVKRLCEHQGWDLQVFTGQGTKIAVTLVG